MFNDLKIGIPFFLFCTVLFACNGGNKKSKSATSKILDTTNAAHLNKPQDLQFLTTEEYVAGIVSRRQAIEKQLPGINQETAAQLYHVFSQYVDTALIGMSNNEGVWLDKYVNYYSEKTHSINPPANVEQRIKLLATAGIEPWGIGEGYTILRLVPTFYTDLFKSSLPPDYKAYLQLVADEDTVLFSADAGIMISVNLVGKRVLNWEKYLDAYPTSIFAPEALVLYERYCYGYLFGEENTPTFDEHEKLSSILPENKTEYISFVRQYENTKTGKIVKTFLDNLTTARSVLDLQGIIAPLIKQRNINEFEILPKQSDFLEAQIAGLTKPVYDTLPIEIHMSGGPSVELTRTTDSIIYFKQNNNIYCLAMFTNTAKGAGAPVSGWVDVWAFKKADDRWQTISYLIEAGGGGMYGSSGYFNNLIKVGDKLTGVVIGGAITHMGSNASWDDLIVLKDDKLMKVLHLVTQSSYEGATGMQKCNENRWLLEHSGKEFYDLIIVSGSCINGFLPINKITIPYKDGSYKVPDKYEYTGI
ncbi:hypothetical protein DVR12_23785 [Chitinophaga silvatica]|uniref:Uncharacterized protein n=2 Tax=Chitinophaga silvatica TaxID=2282649 RepID=A0A3E1Y3J5_9BACT|nr:hypothetical protein DVR12_23785 [Chitinophaga silvatica]